MFTGYQCFRVTAVPCIIYFAMTVSTVQTRNIPLVNETNGTSLNLQMNTSTHYPVKIALVSYLITLFLISISANSIVLKVFQEHKEVRLVPSNAFLASLCALNLLFTLLAIPVSVITLLFDNIAIKTQLCFYVRGLSITYSLVTLATATVLSIDRFNFIFVKGTMLRRLGTSKPLRVIFWIWSVCFVYSSIATASSYIKFPVINCVTLKQPPPKLHLKSLLVQLLSFLAFLFGITCFLLTGYCFLRIVHFFKCGRNQLRPIDVPHNRKILNNLSSGSLGRCLIVLGITLACYTVHLTALALSFQNKYLPFIVNALTSRLMWVLCAVTPCICTRSKIFKAKYKFCRSTCVSSNSESKESHSNVIVLKDVGKGKFRTDSVRPLSGQLEPRNDQYPARIRIISRSHRYVTDTNTKDEILMNVPSRNRSSGVNHENFSSIYSDNSTNNETGSSNEKRKSQRQYTEINSTKSKAIILPPSATSTSTEQFEQVIECVVPNLKHSSDLTVVSNRYEETDRRASRKVQAARSDSNTTVYETEVQIHHVKSEDVSRSDTVHFNFITRLEREGHNQNAQAHDTEIEINQLPFTTQKAANSKSVKINFRASLKKNAWTT